MMMLGVRWKRLMLSPVAGADVHDFMLLGWGGETPASQMARTIRLFGVDADQIMHCCITSSGDSPGELQLSVLRHGAQCCTFGLSQHLPI